MIKNQNISLNHAIVQGKGNIASDMGGEKVMLSIDNGKYYNLGETGGRIWDLIETPTSIQQVITTLMSEYDIQQVQCEEQVLFFLQRLLHEGLIQIEDKVNSLT